MPLNLIRPLAVFDLETTGINITHDRIVEIAIVKYHPNGETEEYYSLVNPEMIIPDEVSAIHGITNKKVATEPTFEHIAEQVKKFLEGCDIGGFNSNQFDIPMLVEEFYRVGISFDTENRSYVDAKVIFHKMEERTLSAAYKFYCNKNLDNAHSAMADTKATLDVILAQTDRYEQVPNDIEGLHEISQNKKRVDFANRFYLNDQEEIIFNFGKYKGQKVTDVLKQDLSYYSWILNADFPRDTKMKLKKIKESMKRE